jgi:hypothetical protein
MFYFAVDRCSIAVTEIIEGNIIDLTDKFLHKSRNEDVQRVTNLLA